MKPTDYEPPPENSCTVFSQPIDTGLEDGRGRPVVVYVQQWDYRGFTVWFCIKLTVLDSELGEMEVERVDCCHGVVHRHTFDATGVETGPPRELRRLYRQEGAWREVDALYSEQSDYYFRNCLDIVGRWCS